jgi:hypothetical protein
MSLTSTGAIWNDCVISIAGNSQLSNLLRFTCRRDVTPPFTNITNASTYGMQMDLRKQVRIQDDNQWPVGDLSICLNTHCPYITTYYCVVPKGNTPCYPQNNLKVTPDNAYIIDLTSLTNLEGKLNDGAKFTMYYFSEDPGRNLESIKNFTFKLDAIKPNVSVHLDMISQQFGPSQWRTNLTATLTLEGYGTPAIDETSTPVTCSFNITPTTDVAALTFNAGNPSKSMFNIPLLLNPSNNKLYTTGDTLQTTYPELSDGKYIYNLSCVDSANNRYDTGDNFTILGNSRIYSPSPDGDTNVSEDYLNSATGLLEIPISVKTDVTGTCKYSNNTINYANMIEFDTTGGKTHSATVHISRVNSSRIYKYFVTCNLDLSGGPQLAYASEGAYPYFAIDDIPPATDILFADPNDNNNYNIYTGTDTSEAFHYLTAVR